MDKKKLMELAERYQCKADTAFQNYQETGITRYDTARRNNEDMAEALRMAASAKEDHDRMIHLRGVLSQLAWRAAEANRASEEDRPRKMQAVLGELLSAARMQGLIRDEEVLSNENRHRASPERCAALPFRSTRGERLEEG